MDLEKPMILRALQHKRFRLPYAELPKHILRIDMWKVSNWSINEYHDGVLEVCTHIC